MKVIDRLLFVDGEEELAKRCHKYVKDYRDKQGKRTRWINKWAELCEYDTTVNAVFHKNTTIVYRNNSTEIACAHCNKKDTFNTRAGKAIAYARLCGEKIPDYI